MLEELRSLRAAIQAQSLPGPGQPATVDERRSLYWREVAEYEQWAFPLFLYLENVDWSDVVAQHEAKRQKSFSTSLWYHKREVGFGYVGRKIKQHDLLPGTNYRLKLTLPIPTPAAYAQRLMREAYDLYTGVYTKMDEEQRAATPDVRRYLADRLKAAARRLGRYEQRTWANIKKWQPDWQLERAVEPEVRRSVQDLSAGELGQVLATVSSFWQHWQAFHSAERELTLESSVISREVSLTQISFSLEHLHPAVQQAAASRFTSGHYSDAIEKACIMLEKEVRERAEQPKDLAGTDLINRVFSQANPILMLSSDRGEREGYMFMFRGMWQALRNHYAHNDTTVDPARTLEWLGFISALLFKLDGIQ